MNNLFEFANKGDKFLCRDGGKAIFIEIVHSDDFNKDFARLYDETTQRNQCYNLDGLKCPPKKLDCDIVSSYQERYTLYMNDDVIDSSDELMDLVDKFEELYTNGCNGLIMDNLTDEVIYGT